MINMRYRPLSRFQLFVTMSLVGLCLLQSSLVLAKSMDSLEDFFGNRFALYPPSPEEEKTVVEFIEQFFDSINVKDTTHVYYLNTSPEFKGKMSYENFRVFINDLDEIDFSKKPQEFNVNFSTDRQQATYTTVLPGKKPKEKTSLEFYLKRHEDGDWKIDSIKVYNLYLKRR